MSIFSQFYVNFLSKGLYKFAPLWGTPLRHPINYWSNYRKLPQEINRKNFPWKFKPGFTGVSL